MEEAYFDSDKLPDYLGEKLFCREERQYAALLYSLFLKKCGMRKSGRKRRFLSGGVWSAGKM